MRRRRRLRGRLIALEGIDGVGKSTLTRALALALRRRGWSVGVHHEPTDRQLGALAQAASVRDPWAGAVYFTLDRRLARPSLVRSLERREIVLSDRSFFSTLAYQGSRLPPRERLRLEHLQRRATIPPDRVILLDLAPAPALGRVGGRRRVRGPLERRRMLEGVARAYRRLARRPEWVIVDARQPVRTLVAEAMKALRLDRAPRARKATRGADAIRLPATNGSG